MLNTTPQLAGQIDFPRTVASRHVVHGLKSILHNFTQKDHILHITQIIQIGQTELHIFKLL